MSLRRLTKSSLLRTQFSHFNPGLLTVTRAYSFYKAPSTVRKVKTEEEIALEKLQKELKSKNWFIRWGAVFRTKEFQKKMTYYYVGAYILFLVFGYKYMNGVWKRDKQIEEISKKQADGPISEYEELKLKELTGKLRRRDELKLQEYAKLQEEGVENFDDVKVNMQSENESNEKILPPRDTTSFYDSKAEDYDSEIDWEEKMVFMGRRRKWLMNHCKGDVLEVSCGTGRNIKYMDMTKIHSITFLDSSSKMMEIANEKFRKAFPSYKNAAFVVGRAEDLVDLATNQTSDAVISVQDTDSNPVAVTEKSKKIKYDTIIEAFGLCSHEDPVKALENFQTLLKPGGRIILLEHGRGEYDFINKVLDNRSEKRLETWGCRWNLDIGEILDDSGLEVTEEKRTHLGTTWCIVAKKKTDRKRKEELSFVEKYISPGIQNRIKELNEEGKGKN
jgi:methyltransferase OMS1